MTKIDAVKAKRILTHPTRSVEIVNDRGNHKVCVVTLEGKAETFYKLGSVLSAIRDIRKRAAMYGVVHVSA